VLYDLRTFGVLYPECILVLVLVCTGGAILGTTLLAILERLEGLRIYGTYVAGMSPVLVCVSSLHLYTFTFNSYGCIPIGTSCTTIPRLSIFM